MFRAGLSMLKHLSRVLLKNFFAERSGLIIAAIIDLHINTKFDVSHLLQKIAPPDKVQRGTQLEIRIA